MINIPKGTKDVIPSESYKWHYIENLVKSVAENFCVKEIRTPTFEHTELFLRGVGDTTDIVNKEMYTLRLSLKALLVLQERLLKIVFLHSLSQQKCTISRLFFVMKSLKMAD